MTPDGLLQTLKGDEVRALFAYLRNPKQSPTLATADLAGDKLLRRGVFAPSLPADKGVELRVKDVKLEVLDVGN